MPPQRKKHCADVLTKLNGLTSQENLFRILKLVDECPEVIHYRRRQTLTQVRQDLIRPMSHTIKIDRGDRAELDWLVLEPSKLLSFMIESSDSLANQYIHAFARKKPTPDAPWGLIIGFDEFAPGNKLKYHNFRKLMVLSFNFVELGSRMLMCEHTWMTPVVIRTTEMRGAAHGWSGMFSMFLTRMLLGPFGMMTAGTAIEIRNRHYTIFAKLTNVIADGDGLRMVLNWMGASGLKPCFLHSNVLAKNHDSIVDDASNDLVDICEADPDKFKVVGDSYMADMMDLVIAGEDQKRAGAISNAKFEQVQTCAGYLL